MKEITTISRTLIVVEVPKDAYNFGCTVTGALYYNMPSKNDKIRHEYRLGLDEKIIGPLSTLTDEQVRELVEASWWARVQYKPTYKESEDLAYKDYSGNGEKKITPLDSFRSLLKSHGVNTDEELLIIEKVKS